MSEAPLDLTVLREMGRRAVSIESTGPAHSWFAWHPVRTDYFGWTWLRLVRRERVFLNVIGDAVSFWSYTRKARP